MSAVYCVLLRDGYWTIRFKGRYFRSGLTREQATEVAVRAAMKAFQEGQRAQVMVHEGERYQTVWLNGSLIPTSEMSLLWRKDIPAGKCDGDTWLH